MEFEEKEKYGISDLLEIVEILRSPDGCPWDKVQTHSSLRQDLIEEAYEVVDGIDSASPEALREELGDLLLQVVFHASLSRQEGDFDFDDVCDEICRKLIIRHPHVFGEVSVSGTDEVLVNWEAIKQREKHQKTASDTIRSVPKSFPALMRAAKLAKRTPGALADKDAAARLFEEKSKAALSVQDEKNISDMLFAAAYFAKSAGVDPEQSLADLCGRYADSFEALEKAGDSGISVEKIIEQ